MKTIKDLRGDYEQIIKQLSQDWTWRITDLFLWTADEKYERTECMSKIVGKDYILIYDNQIVSYPIKNVSTRSCGDRLEMFYGGCIRDDEIKRYMMRLIQENLINDEDELIDITMKRFGQKGSKNGKVYHTGEICRFNKIAEELLGK